MRNLKIRMIAAVTAAVFVSAAAAAGCGSAESSSSVTDNASVSDIPAVSDISDASVTEPVEVKTTGVFLSSEDVVRDILKDYEGTPHVYLSDASETYEKFTIFFSEGTTVSSLVEAWCYFKDFFTMEMIEDLDMTYVYPEFISTADDTEKTISETADLIVLTLVYDDLSAAPDADTYAAQLENIGAIELDPVTMEAAK